MNFTTQLHKTTHTPMSCAYNTLYGHNQHIKQVTQQVIGQAKNTTHNVFANMVGQVYTMLLSGKWIKDTKAVSGINSSII